MNWIYNIDNLLASFTGKQVAMNSEIDPRTVLLRAFPGIPSSQAEEIIQASQEKNYPAGTVLCHEGAYETIFYILLEGEVRVSKWLNPHEERVLKQLGRGDFFGEMAIVNNAPRAATVMAITPVTVLEVLKDSFASLLERSSHLSLALMREVSRRLRENDQMAIDDLRLKASELAEAYQQLSELEIARREFLTTIAHELRTPLMAANGYLEAIRMGAMQGEALTNAIDTVYRNLQEVTALTNDILFVQEMDLILPEFTPSDIGEIVSSAVEQQRTHAAKNGVTLNLSISPSLPKIRAEARSLTRAVNAILDNAIKFSPEGGEVQVEAGGDTAMIWIRVQDHGVGIPREVQGRIFDRFFHLDQVGKHLFRGVGLGLSIARQVVEQHNGKIVVESQLGVGSTFTILFQR